MPIAATGRGVLYPESLQREFGPGLAAPEFVCRQPTLTDG